MPYATLLDVTVEYGPVPDAKVEKTETKLDQAEDLIRVSFPDLDERVADGRTTVSRVKQVEVEMVCSVLRNEDGVSNSSTYETVGPFARQQSRTFASAGAPSLGLLEVTARHRWMLGERALPSVFVVPLS